MASPAWYTGWLIDGGSNFISLRSGLFRVCPFRWRVPVESNLQRVGGQLSGAERAAGYRGATT